MAITNKTFSENLIKFRRKNGMSQNDLAKVTGISPRMIAHYEKHATYPPIDKIEVIANALKVDVSDLLGFKNSKGNNQAQEDFFGFDTRTIKKIKKIALLNPQDRFAVYQMIDLLLQKDEYKNKDKELQEIESK